MTAATCAIGPGARVESDIRAQPAALAAVLATNAEALAAARTRLSPSRLVRLAAIGSSRHAAGYGAACLELCAGIPTSVLPAAGAGVSLPRFTAADAVVVVSQSGETPALLQSARIAQESGATVIAVVNATDSPLQRLAEVTLQCDAGTETAIAATKSVTAQMLLLRAFAAPIEPSNLDRLIAAVANLIDSFDPTVLFREPDPDLAHIVCGGVGAEWVADEIALKAAEMVGRLLTSESIVDHLHGPAAVSARTLAFLETGDLNNAALLRRHEVLSVGVAESFDLVVPATGDATLDPIVRIVIGQLAMLAWSRRLGEDADAPRGLTKVTRSH